MNREVQQQWQYDNAGQATWARRALYFPKAELAAAGQHMEAAPRPRGELVVVRRHAQARRRSRSRSRSGSRVTIHEPNISRGHA